MASERPLLITGKITGVEGLRNIIQGVDFAATQLAPGACTGELLHADLDGLQFSCGIFDADVRLRSIAPSVNVVLGTVLNSDGAVSHWNNEVIEGDICVCPPGHHQEGHFRGRTSYAVVSLPLEGLRDAACEFDDLWSEIGSHRPSVEMREATCRKLTTCISMLRALGPELSARARKFMRDEILDSYLDALADAALAGSPPASAASSARTVKLVEDYLTGHFQKPVRVNELCAELKISRRTLYRAFQETLGVGPKTYLRLASLSTARRALVEAPPGSTSVTEVALDHGFLELGRFSVLYRQMFGESPSDTLRR
ncbi:MAG TPA: helix-turn-helix domain-containing protein [Parvibaculum sp.]|jgi:AraC family ethanolamine operon transcriptional activator